MYHCKTCDFSGSGTKICPICYLRLLKERDRLAAENAELRRRLEQFETALRRRGVLADDLAAIAEGRDNG